MVIQHRQWSATTHSTLVWSGVVVVLLVAVAAAHGSALDAYWRFDDGAHLSTAARYSPWQYFLVPEYVRGISAGAHITPWNILFYDINLSLFGLQPAPFYAHQLLAIWLTAVATFALLRLWLGAIPALLGALLFVLGAPTTYVAQQLMTGHYAAGLLFSVCALYAFARALRAESWYWATAATICYFLAVNCKEIYVPLIGILPFLPERDWRVRLRFASPMLLIAVAYAIWRTIVLGTLVGGYRPDVAAYDAARVAAELAQVPALLFPQQVIGTIALATLAVAMIWGMSTRRIAIGLVLVATFLLVAPLIPLTIYPGVHRPDRFLFFAWWGICVLFAVLVALGDKTHRRWMVGFCVLVVLVAAGRAHRIAERTVADEAREFSTVYRFILASQPNQVFVPRRSDNDYLWLVNSLLASVETDLDPGGPHRARVVRTDVELLSIKPQGLSFWAYSPDCDCVTEITDAIARRKPVLE